MTRKKRKKEVTAAKFKQCFQLSLSINDTSGGLTPKICWNRYIAEVKCNGYSVTDSENYFPKDLSVEARTSHKSRQQMKSRN